MKFKEHDGTIGGILGCLENCKTNEKITAQTNKETIDDIIQQIQALKERHFSTWIKNYPGYNRIPGFIASYDDFKKAAESSKSTKCVLTGSITEWTESMARVIKEGDQIWMWRGEKFPFLSYAHVGIYIGEGMMVHVSRNGINGIIRKDPILDVIKTSKCFIVKPDLMKLEMMSGTPKVKMKK